jgi:hypothetical protein
MSFSSNSAVRRVLALLVLTLLLPAVLPAAGTHTPKPAPVESFWSRPFESLWRYVASVACTVDSDACPVPKTTGGCDKGAVIDPNGCAH